MRHAVVCQSVERRDAGLKAEQDLGEIKRNCRAEAAIADVVSHDQLNVKSSFVVGDLFHELDRVIA